MRKEEICDLLKKNENLLFDFFRSQPSDFWERQPEGKWSAGQHVIHLIQSTRPLLKGISLPNFILKWKFGTCNRATRNYDQMKQKYEEKLAEAGNVVSPFSRNMTVSFAADQNKYFEEFSELNNKLNKVTSKINEAVMDQIVIPHPLMGKLTLREMLMWNTYHLEHHIRILREKYHS